MTTTRQRTGGVTHVGSRYRGRIQVNGETLSRMFDTEQQAWDWLLAIREAAAGYGPEVTLASACRSWLDEREVDGRHKSVASQRRVYRAHIRDWGKAQLPIKRLRRVHVRDYLRELATDRRPQTLRNILAVIRGALAWAHDGGLVGENVAEGMRVPKTAQEASAEPEWLRLDEIDRVLALPLDPARRALFAVAIYAGLRKSELLHLRWSCVTLAGPFPEVRVEAPLKTRMAKRRVPLLPRARDALAALKATQKPAAVQNIAPLVWPSPSGRVRAESYTGQWMDKRWTGTDGELHVTPGVRTLAGIERPATFHALRHTCASHLVQGSWAPPMRLEDVRQWMGHSSLAVTQRYGHMAPGGLHLLLRERAEQENDGC